MKICGFEVFSINYLSVVSSAFFTLGFELNRSARPSRISFDANFSSCTLSQNDFSENFCGAI